jgi:tRNA1(Val) A37 N6-methylase TrmN6
MTSPVEPDLTDDRLLGGRLRFLQPRRGYRVAIDPVLLAAAVAARPGERVLDAGTGTGAAALCLAARVPGAAVIGLERDAELLAIGRRNADASLAVAPIDLVAGDLLAPPALLAARPFDHVMSNPPYHRRGAATPPVTATGAAAHLAEVALPAWIGACLALLRPSGRLTLIHRADALADLLAALTGRAGDVVVFPLWPNVDAPAAKRVVVAARKGGRGPSRLARGLVLHELDGRYTEAAEAILRDGAPIPL